MGVRMQLVLLLVWIVSAWAASTPLVQQHAAHEVERLDGRLLSESFFVIENAIVPDLAC